MKCPVCVEEGLTSKLFPDGVATTLMYCAPYYDEEGIRHHHDDNTLRSEFQCSNGHRFVIKSHVACPSYPRDCDYEGDQEVVGS